MQHEWESRLPVYQAKRSTDFAAFLVVTCGYDDCPGTKGGRPFLVAEKEWMRPQRIYAELKGKTFIVTGRACPYCFRTGRLPRRIDIR